MNSEKAVTRKSFVLFLTLIFVYIVLFEFILPVNRVLPKPSILAESFIHVWRDYNLFTVSLITISVIYLGLIISYCIAFIFSEWIYKLLVGLEETVETFRLFRYFTLIFFVILFNFWFPEELFAEYMIACLAALLLAIQKLYMESKNIKKEYLDVANNLSLDKKNIYRDIYWKSVQPSLAKYYENIHYSLWGVILLYEFIGNYSGLGYAYRNAFLYKDYTAIIIFAVMISVLIWGGNCLTRILKKNLINWTD